jgi:hypothetical protein
VDDRVPSTPQNIKPCPEAKNGVHRWIWHAACRLAATGVSPAEAEAYIMARLTRQPDPPNEVTASIAKAYRLQTELPKNTKWNGIPFEKPEFCPNKLERIAASMDGVDANWLARRSSVRVDNRTPASFLHALFHKGEHVLVFDKFRGLIRDYPTMPEPSISSAKAQRRGSGFFPTHAMATSTTSPAWLMSNTTHWEPHAALRRV